MIEINYDREKERVFDLSYFLKEYIPDSIYMEYPINTELHFMQKLLDKDPDIHYLGSSEMIWSIDYKYKYKEKIFTLVLDEDYGFISYAVDDSKERNEIAEYLKRLIENRLA